MKPYISFLIMLAAFSVNAYAAKTTSNPETTLYCSGTSWQSVSGDTAANVDALIKVSNNSLYIEISAVAFGRTKEPPKAMDSITVSGELVLKRAYQGGGNVNAGYSLNRYDGMLVVYPSDMKSKSLFDGTCKLASPLF